MATRKKEVEVDESLVKAVAMIVDMLPRNQNKKASANDHTVVLYKGVLQQEVATTFYALLAKRAHPLANVKDENCSYDRPCGACRRCVLEAHSKIAEDSGAIVKVPRGKFVTRDNKQVRVTWVTYYRPGEITLSEDLSKVADMVLAKLA